MKKLIVIGIVMVMVMGLAGVASAAFVPDSIIKMGLTFTAGTMSQGTLTVGTNTGASDGYVVGQDLGYPSAISGAGEIICYDLVGQGSVPDGRFNTDLRAPIITPSACKAWHLRAYVNGGAARTAVLRAWMTSTGKKDSVDYDVKLYVGTWTAEQCLSGAAGTALWLAPINASGTSTTPQYTLSGITMAEYEERLYTVTICTVPEPGSMVALFSGLVGLVGFGIRRRK